VLGEGGSSPSSKSLYSAAPRLDVGNHIVKRAQQDCSGRGLRKGFYIHAPEPQPLYRVLLFLLRPTPSGKTHLAR
jgi:hypothetical protein